jgi:hypothetical protein
LLGDFNAKVAEKTFIQIIGDESINEIINDNGVRVVNFATSKNLIVKVQCSLIATYIYIIGHF